MTDDFRITVESLEELRVGKLRFEILQKPEEEHSSLADRLGFADKG